MPNGIRSRSSRGGFTLIELLVVIGIIVILVGILLPVVSTMRKRAENTDSTAEITRIAVACNNYYNDYHAYPGPVPESLIYGNNGQLSQTAALTGASIISSSENLVLGLEGGIVPPTSATATTYTYNVTLVTKGPQSLNYMQPQQVSPYYDTSSPELANNGAGVLTSWTTTQGGTYATPALTIPEMMDHFSNPHPIIYLRAVVGGTSICDQARNSSSPGSQYFTAELNPYWRVYTSTVTLTSPTLPTATTTATSGTFSTPDASNNKVYQSSYYFFQNATINDGITPRSKDSFILISAGYDGIYGTTDDILYSN
ncbi:MAG TPA: prepilin-type N-terminal cleavage/methylation domain-containing protein [Tepidisphaeraceae bacterium]|jgi:prepilin-type N-terminal cleavage/methylation domain-containing protein|nr:prepilin-type N-terminal cleavage/methylation domain-containing protein [Tepidisphaeraceae bacterium]